MGIVGAKVVERDGVGPKELRELGGLAAACFAEDLSFSATRSLKK